MHKNIAVAMSGGVDSSLAALLLKEEGHRVWGVTLKLWDDQPESVFDDARSVADRIGIEHRVLDARDFFQQKIIDYFSQEYSRGRTPNPCVVCNDSIKFGLLLQWALEQGADYVASGHYVRIRQDENSGMYQLLKAEDEAKDQSYMLWRLGQNQLKHLLFPLGTYTKEEIRKRAADYGIPVADKPDSQEICFIPDNDYRSFLEKERNGSFQPGKLCTADGKELGTHSGIENYTVGQRKNLGVAAGYPLHVIRIDPASNRIIVGKRSECYQRCLNVEQVNFVSIDPGKDEMPVWARIRYNMKEAAAVLEQRNPKGYRLCFKDPQWAVTPGQSAVFYQGEILVGGGIIAE